MRQWLIQALLWASTIASALIAGLYFAFSAVIMTALHRIGQASGVAAMNAINLYIQRSLFMPIFLGSTLTAAALVVIALIYRGESWAKPALAGGLLYVVGMFVVTMVRNVPLNNQLAAANPAAEQTAPIWAVYLKEWTAWNTVRTVASVVAFVLFIISVHRVGSE